MHYTSKSWWLLVIPTFCLWVLGLVIISLVGSDLARNQFWHGLLGLLLILAFSKIDISWFKVVLWLWYAIATVPLALTELFGVVSRGSTRWLNLFGVQFQPSELTKFGLILFASAYITRMQIHKEGSVGKYILLMTVPLGLIFFQPDLGSAILIGSIIIISLFLLPITRKQWIGLGGLGFIVISLVIFSLKPYQRERINSFLRPNNDLLTSGYNANQAIITIGSGQWFGRGLGRGTQSRLRFLPERHTDFIFATMIEEIGGMGGLAVLILFFGWITTFFWISQKTESIYLKLLTLLSGGLLLTQVVVNVGMNMGLLPITGVTLPLVSYGGSSLVVTMALVGIGAGAGRRVNDRRASLEIK